LFFFFPAEDAIQKFAPRV